MYNVITRKNAELPLITRQKRLFHNIDIEIHDWYDNRNTWL